MDLVAFTEIPERELRGEQQRNKARGKRRGVVFTEIPERELRVGRKDVVLIPLIKHPVAFKEIPQRELRVQLSSICLDWQQLVGCIQRNPTKGIESS
jgi:hypothetical protein